MRRRKIEGVLLRPSARLHAVLRNLRGKKGVKPNKADFKAVIDEIAKAVEKQQSHTENQ